VQRYWKTLKSAAAAAVFSHESMSRNGAIIWRHWMSYCKKIEMGEGALLQWYIQRRRRRLSDEIRFGFILISRRKTLSA